MTHPWRLSFVVALVVSLNVAKTQPQSTGYRHDIYFPGYVQGSVQYGGSRPVSVSAGLYLNPPPTVFPFMPLLPSPAFARRQIERQHAFIERFLQQAVAGGNRHRKPPPSAASLFVPNTVQQPAETAGQIDNYKKALEEEARELEKQQNDITTQFNSEIADLLTATNKPKGYVNVQFNTGTDLNYKYTV